MEFIFFLIMGIGVLLLMSQLQEVDGLVLLFGLILLLTGAIGLNYVT